MLILSGKGGVGKSSTTLQLALTLTQQGHNVGILDIDLTGPSIPRLLNLEDKKVTQAPRGWLPVKVHDAVQPQSAGDTNGAQTSSSSSTARGSLHALSLAFLLPSRESAVIWRGPKKTAMIRQFVSDVFWPPNTDYLLIDTLRAPATNTLQSSRNYINLLRMYNPRKPQMDIQGRMLTQHLNSPGLSWLPLHKPYQLQM